MRIKVAFVAVIAAMVSMLAVPTAAQAAPDDLACSAAGSYSRYVGGTPMTFWLVGTVGNYRYWHVVYSQSSTHDRSYVVKCGSTGNIVSSTDLAVTASSGDRCGTTSTDQYQYVGSQTALVSYPPFWLEYDFRYWHVHRWVTFGYFGFWIYDHSEMARCLAP